MHQTARTENPGQEEKTQNRNSRHPKSLVPRFMRKQNQPGGQTPSDIQTHTRKSYPKVALFFVVKGKREVICDEKMTISFLFLLMFLFSFLVLS